MLKQDTFSIVKEKIPEGKTFCSLCSRLRRGILYNAAVELGATKIALGHHRDDLIETLLLNLFFGGQIKSMPPRLVSDDGRNVVIRPLAYCREADVAAFAEAQAFPIIPCDLCGSQEQLQRKRVKRMVAELAAENETIPANLFAALSRVVPSHLLDRELRAALGPSAGRGADAQLLDIG
jgi:tRNA 2-thiocytidine biosynthesis protein TtcA